MTEIKAVVRPESLHEAWTQLERGGRTARLLGGGVDLAWLAPPGIDTLIDLVAVTGSDVRCKDGELHLGAGATLTEILESDEVAPYAGGMVHAVLRRVASPLQRNLATLGGAIAGAHPWSDVLTLLLALDARVVRYAGHDTVCDVESLLSERGTLDRAILTDVILPALAPGTTVAFDKVSRTGFDIAMLNCACRVTQVAGTCQDVRVVLGGTPGIASRLASVEAMLTGEPLTQTLVDRAAERASEEIPAKDDLRASGAYRRVLASVTVRQCLGQMLHQPGEAR